MNVRDLMSAPTITVTPDTRVAEVARLMVMNHLSGLPVTRSDGSLAGLITDADVVTKHAAIHGPGIVGILGFTLELPSRDQNEEIRRILAVTAGELMEERVISIEPERTVEDAATLMVDRHVDPLPVAENGQLVGVISRADILRLVMTEEQDADSSGG